MNYISVRTATLRPDVELLFDVYIFYKEKYIPYKKSAETFDEITLSRFKGKKIKKVFISEEQEPSYLKYLDQALEQLQAVGLKTEDKAELAQDTLKQESDNIEKTLESEESYKNSESRIHKVVDFMLKEPKALANMLASAGLSIDDSAHGSTVSSLALAIGSAVGSLNKDGLTDLAIAGLLHDTGLKTLGFDISSNLENVDKEKKTQFKKHPIVAIEQVAGKKFITPRVLRIIQDHEEYGQGLGFPEKKNYARLELDSKIFNLCDAFDHFSILKKKAAKDCIEEFLEARADHFDLQLLEVLEKQIKA